MSCSICNASSQRKQKIKQVSPAVHLEEWLFRSLDENPSSQWSLQQLHPIKHSNYWSEESTQTLWSPAENSEIMGKASKVNESQCTFTKTRKTSEGSRGSLCFLKVTLLMYMLLTESSPVFLPVFK